jgi:hypothetical protein
VAPREPTTIESAVLPKARKHSCPGAADLDVWLQHQWHDGIQIDALQDLDTFAVRTRNSVYEITIVSARHARVLVRGGRFFPAHTAAWLAGSSLGGSFLKQHGIYVGFRMELQYERHSVVTTEVRSIERIHDLGTQ